MCCRSGLLLTAAAGTGAGVSADEETVSAALHKVVHEVLGDDLTLNEAKQMLSEVDASKNGKISLQEVRTTGGGVGIVCVSGMSMCMCMWLLTLVYVPCAFEVTQLHVRWDEGSVVLLSM